VDLVLAFAELALTTVLMSVFNQALSLSLVTVSLVLLLAAALTGAMLVGISASVGINGNVGNGCNFSNGVVNWCSEGCQARSVLEKLGALTYKGMPYPKPRMARRTVLVKSILKKSFQMIVV
jgi:hypothetical protein